MSLIALRSDDPCHIIPELMRRFYDLGWFSGSGGALSMRDGDTAYISPSGMPKELVTPDEVYKLSLSSGSVMRRHEHESSSRISTCTPLFKAIYRLTDCNCAIHAHSLDAVLCTMISEDRAQFTIANAQMIKCIRYRSTWMQHQYTDTLHIPIVENGLTEEDIEEPLSQALVSHPDTCCVLIRHHGFYVFGRTWMETKNMAEAYDYLFKLTIEKHKLGLK